jgi:hypothetical protein
MSDAEGLQDVFKDPLAMKYWQVISVVAIHRIGHCTKSCGVKASA